MGAAKKIAAIGLLGGLWFGARTLENASEKPQPVQSIEEFNEIINPWRQDSWDQAQIALVDTAEQINDPEIFAQLEMIQQHGVLTGLTTPGSTISNNDPNRIFIVPLFPEELQFDVVSGNDTLTNQVLGEQKAVYDQDTQTIYYFGKITDPDWTAVSIFVAAESAQDHLFGEWQPN